MFDQNTSLPISGGVILATLTYAATSVYVLGPLVAERTIEHSGWQDNCKTALHAQLETQRTPPKVIPKMDCRSTLGAILPDLAVICEQYGNPDWGAPLAEVQRKQERWRQQAEDKRLALAAAQSGSQCQCAAAIVAEDRAWALHAGSLRLITPLSVSGLQAELQQALYTPHCSRQGGAL